MPFELRSNTGEIHLDLSGRLGVQQARPLWNALLAAMPGATSLQVEASLVDEMDTSVTQILCRLNRGGIPLRFSSPSDRFLGALKSRGLERFFFETGAPPSTPEPLPQPQGPECRVSPRRKERARDGKKNSRSR